MGEPRKKVRRTVLRPKYCKNPDIPEQPYQWVPHKLVATSSFWDSSNQTVSVLACANCGRIRNSRVPWPKEEGYE